MKKLILFIIILSSTDILGQVIRKGDECEKNNSLISGEDKATKKEIRIINRRKMRDVGLDTSGYFHIGIIPYQILSRSSGLYIGLDSKKSKLS